MRNVILIICIFTVTAAAYTPTALSPEDIKAFNHCTDAVTLDFDDFTNATASAFNEEIERIFDGGESVLFVTPSETHDDGKGNSNYTEFSLGGGLDRLEAYAFEGLQTGPITVIGGYEENRSQTKNDLYDVAKRTGGGSLMLSDPAGTMLGIAADYAGKKEIIGDGIATEIPSTGFDSGRITAAYRSHFWGTSKLSTKISDTYSRQTLNGPAVTDNLVEADTDFTFLWLGDNSLRGAVTLRQENVNDSSGDSVGVLFTRIVIDNDFRVSEKIRVGVGLGGFVLRRDSTLTRLYPRGSVHLGLTRHVGVFAKYRPYMRLPAFRELYYETDYSAAADYIPFTEAYGAFEIGVVNNVYDSLHTEISFYEKRFRNDYARENVPGDFKTAYHDLGKYYNRGLSARAQLNFRRFISVYGRYVYDRFGIIDVRGGHIPYRPSNTFTTGFLVGEETGHNVTAELKRVDERFGNSTGTIILPPAVIADAALRLRLRRGITVYVKGENLNDATYSVIYGVPAPGRTISAGLKLVI